MLRRRVLVSALAVTTLTVVSVLAGCSSLGGPGPEPGLAATASSGVVVTKWPDIGEIQREVPDGAAHVFVSNQSFDDDPVHLTISIDDTQVIVSDFHVEGQHTWVGFLLTGLEPGPHVLHAMSDTGVEESFEFEVLADAPRHLVLNYWFYPGDDAGRHFEFTASDQPFIAA